MSPWASRFSVASYPIRPVRQIRCCGGESFCRLRQTGYGESTPLRLLKATGPHLRKQAERHLTLGIACLTLFALLFLTSVDSLLTCVAAGRYETAQGIQPRRVLSIHIENQQLFKDCRKNGGSSTCLSNGLRESKVFRTLSLVYLIQPKRLFSVSCLFMRKSSVFFTICGLYPPIMVCNSSMGLTHGLPPRVLLVARIMS